MSPIILLVYEYMANGSLDKFLFGEKCGTLNCKQQFNIIIGMAWPCISSSRIPCDIKSSNALLDAWKLNGNNLIELVDKSLDPE
uniref:Serine-threonine/tyrosine-protein kinase catalytic domain-containing protein n=1 Tax=Leersia perrieri TaxID=77586 RepID=A0A0D9XKS4_9ORYZ